MKQKNETYAILLCIGGLFIFVFIMVLTFYKVDSQPSSLSSRNFLDNLFGKFTGNDNSNASTGTSEDTSSPTLIPVGGYQDKIELKNEICDLYLFPNGDMKKVSAPASLFKDTDKSEGLYNPGDRAVYFEMGYISGTVGDMLVPEETKYYLVEYDKYPLGYPYPEGWQYLGVPVRFFLLNDKVYVVSGALLITEAEDPGFGYITSETTDANGEIYYNQAKSIQEDNVVILNKEDVDFIDTNTYTGLAYSNDLTNPLEFFFASSKGANFVVDASRVSNTLPSDYKKVDVYKDSNIYVNARKSYLIKDREGFFLTIQLIGPTFTMEDYIYTEISGNSPSVTWQDGTQASISTYDSSYGTCESSKDATVGFVYENVNISDLIEVGSVNQKTVYEKKNIASDVFTKKLYDDDYNSSDQLWKYNNITEDDNRPLTYSEYISYHPVIYIQDVYGNFIRYTNNNFMMIGGCAKPAIYLYPQTNTEVNVSVIPNGKLTFTNPSYKNGWSVEAYPTGKLLNLIDNKLYDYLWWESYTYKLNIPSDGFVIAKSEVSSFLDKELKTMNLSAEEISQFKDYWVAKIQEEDTDYIFVTFLFNKDVDQIAQLKITPKPDNIFRVFMLYKPVKSYYLVNPLTIASVNRSGFTLVEWGGARI